MTQDEAPNSEARPGFTPAHRALVQLLAEIAARDWLAQQAKQETDPAGAEPAPGQ